MNRRILACLTLALSLSGCFLHPAMTCLDIRSESEEVELVGDLWGIGFDPYDDPRDPTNSQIPGRVGKSRASHCAWTRIIVHDEITLSLRDKEGRLHSPKVEVVGKVPGKKDYGQVDIVILSPEQVIVTVGERPDS